MESVAISILLHSISFVTKLRLDEIIVWCHVCTMNVSIHCCYWKQRTWPRWWQRDKGSILILVIVKIAVTLVTIRTWSTSTYLLFYRRVIWSLGWRWWRAVINGEGRAVPVGQLCAVPVGHWCAVLVDQWRAAIYGRWRAVIVGQWLAVIVDQWCAVINS